MHGQCPGDAASQISTLRSFLTPRDVYVSKSFPKSGPALVWFPHCHILCEDDYA